MNDSDKKLNVVPGLAAGALLVSIAALVANDEPSAAATGSMSGMSSDSMSGMSSEDMEHMEPLPIDGIADAPSDKGGTPFTEPPGKWLLHCHIGHHLTNDGDGSGGLLTLVRST